MRVERGNVVSGGAMDDADAPFSEEEHMSAIERPPAIVRWTLRLEETTALDRPVRALEPSIRFAFGTGKRASVLRGEWLGHAIHPLLTDVVLGTWTSATLLDLFGGPGSSAAAQRLVGAGLLAVGPTAWAGWAEWSAAGSREKRVGLVHAVTNAVAISVYAASWTARRNGRHRTGARLALAGATVSGVGAYLGGHLIEARKVSSRHPAYDNVPSETRRAPPPVQRLHDGRTPCAAEVGRRRTDALGAAKPADEARAPVPSDARVRDSLGVRAVLKVRSPTAV